MKGQGLEEPLKNIYDENGYPKYTQNFKFENRRMHPTKRNGKISPKIINGNMHLKRCLASYVKRKFKLKARIGYHCVAFENGRKRRTVGTYS